MLIEHLSRQLLEREARSLRRRRRMVDAPCSPHVRVSSGARFVPMRSFCSNDYLGLASHPELRQALADGALRWGAGSGASHLVSGHMQPHAALENELADWLAPCIPGGHALTFCSGYMANISLLAALGDGHATIFADRLSHASLIDGALLAKAPMQRYPHARVDLLAAQLERCTTPIKLIVTDSVFSMDGDLADLPALLALAERFDAWLVIDDAHGVGVLGEQGRGALSHHRLCSDRLIYMGTFGKAAGVAGAFVVAHPTVVEWLIQAGRTYIYTTATPPAVVHAVLASVRLIRGPEGDQRRARLVSLIRLLRERLESLVAAHAQLGWTLGNSATAIQPLIVGDNETALRLSAALEAQGLWVPAIRPPTVPQGSARLRITLSAAHVENDVLHLMDALATSMRC